MSEETKSDEKKFWFPAKKYGIGWGLPNCWQGWLVFLSYIGLLVATLFLFSPDKHPASFAGCYVILTAILTVILFLKGEKAGWHWGGK